MQKLTMNNFLMGLLSILVLKAAILSSMSIGEALLGIALVGYCGFLKYLEHFQAHKVHADYEDRLNKLESRMKMVDLGRAMSNQR